MGNRRPTLGRSLFAAAILVIAAMVWGIAATAGSLRNGSTTSAQVTGALPGQTLWTYYNTSSDPAGAGDNIITLVNPNGSANSNLESPAANTCAMIYVFDDDQEMGECCGCPLTPAGIETFSVENDFTSDWGISGATGLNNGNGSIAIVAVGTNVPFVPAGPLSNGFFCPAAQTAACNGGCDPTDQPGYSFSIGLNLLGSIVHNQLVANDGLTEAPLFDNGGGDPANLAYLQAQCGALVGNGTGGGICKCPRPDPDAAPSPRITPTATPTASSTGTPTATATATPTPSATATSTSTATPTATPTPTGCTANMTGECPNCTTNGDMPDCADACVAFCGGAGNLNTCSCSEDRGTCNATCQTE